MRKNRENQMPLTPLWPDHRLGDELQMISRILDNNPEILHWVLQDLSDKADPCNGSPGLSAEQVVRCAVIKNWHGLSYEKLAFHVDDSASFRGLLPFASRMVSRQELSSREHLEDSSFDLATNHSGVGGLGQSRGVGEGPQDPGRCHSCRERHPPSLGLSAFVRFGA